MRAKLRTLYATTFKGDDPGLPINTSDSRNLSLEQSYVVPDILTVRAASSPGSAVCFTNNLIYSPKHQATIQDRI